jgi:hypothetical protein
MENYEYNGLSVKAISLNPEAITVRDRYSELRPVFHASVIFLETSPFF